MCAQKYPSTSQMRTILRDWFLHEKELIVDDNHMLVWIHTKKAQTNEHLNNRQLNFHLDGVLADRENRRKFTETCKENRAFTDIAIGQFCVIGLTPIELYGGITPELPNFVFARAR